jgi:hypothetical protein
LYTIAFESLNSEFRYQLTPIGAPGPNLQIAEEISNQRFKIAGGTAAIRVYWQLTRGAEVAFQSPNEGKVEHILPGQQRLASASPFHHTECAAWLLAPPEYSKAGYVKLS